MTFELPVTLGQVRDVGKELRKPPQTPTGEGFQGNIAAGRRSDWKRLLVTNASV